MKHFFLYIVSIGICSCSTNRTQSVDRDITLTVRHLSHELGVQFVISNCSEKNYEFPLAFGEPLFHAEIQSGTELRRFVDNNTWDKSFRLNPNSIRTYSSAAPVYHELLAGKIYEGSIELATFKEYNIAGRSLHDVTIDTSITTIKLKLPYRECAGGSEYGEIETVLLLKANPD